MMTASRSRGPRHPKSGASKSGVPDVLVQTRVTEETRRWLEAQADKHEMSVAAYVRAVLVTLRKGIAVNSDSSLF